MGWLTSNWIWIGLIGAMVAMHLRHGGHGGHGGHGRSHGGHAGGDSLPSDENSRSDGPDAAHTVQSPTTRDEKASAPANHHRC